LANVARHSRATHVSLSLIKSDHDLEFAVRDDGIGIDLEKAKAQGGFVGKDGKFKHEAEDRTLQAGASPFIRNSQRERPSEVSWPLS